jgi:hypothetical protein
MFRRNILPPPSGWRVRQEEPVFLNVTLCSSGRGLCLVRKYCFHLQGWRVSQGRNQQKRATSYLVPLEYSSTLRMEAVCYSETSGPLQSSRRYNPEDRTLHSHCNENFILTLLKISFRNTERMGSKCFVCLFVCLIAFITRRVWRFRKLDWLWELYYWRVCTLCWSRCKRTENWSCCPVTRMQVKIIT